MHSDEMVLFFVKYPEPGRVKTRLAPMLDAGQAALLARAMAEDTLSSLLAAGRPLRVCHAPAEAGDRVRDWLGPRLDYAPQTGPDLGRRMADAFRRAFADGVKRAVLVGSDLPDLPVERADEAFAALSLRPACLGPAWDGGYYLVGFNREAFNPAAFEDIEWGGPNVLRQSIRALRGLGQEPFLLPDHCDVDDPPGLRRLLASPDLAERCPRTFGVLKNLDLPPPSGA